MQLDINLATASLAIVVSRASHLDQALVEGAALQEAFPAKYHMLRSVLWRGLASCHQGSVISISKILTPESNGFSFWQIISDISATGFHSMAAAITPCQSYLHLVSV